MPAEPKRLLSLDALRGFDMAWILGGGLAVRAWDQAGGPAWVATVAEQTTHVEWHGFRAWDLIFPLFLFLAGVSLPFSYAKRVAAGAQRLDLALHALRRGVVLVLLGLVYNGLLRFDLDTLRTASVLGRIGLAYAGAACLVIWLPKVRDQAIAAGVLLLGSWGLLSIAAPGEEAASLEMGKNLFDWFDRRFLPGRLYQDVHDPEGLLATLPAIVTALAGTWAGRYLASKETHELRSAFHLAIAGVIALFAGWAWDHVLPFNKHLWTSSFVCWCAGWSLLLLATFYALVDVLGLARLGWFFGVIGANSILLYLTQAFVDWHELGPLVFGRAEGRLHPGLMAATGLFLQWLLAAWLYKRRIFLRV